MDYIEKKQKKKKKCSPLPAYYMKPRWTSRSYIYIYIYIRKWISTYKPAVLLTSGTIGAGFLR